MEIKVTKTKEWTKGGFLSGKTIRYNLEVSVSLSETEKSLVQKYFDPSILPTHLQEYFKSEESFKVLKIDKLQFELSKFSIVAHSDLLGNIQQLEEAVRSQLIDRIDELQSIDAWDGQETIQH